MRLEVWSCEGKGLVKEVDAAFVFSSLRRPVAFTSSTSVDLCVVVQPSLRYVPRVIVQLRLETFH